MVEDQGMAMVYSTYGDPFSNLRSIRFKIPEPSKGQVLLKLLACPINPSDLNQVQGTYLARPPMTNELDPDTPSAVGGNEGAYEVVKIGEGVERFRVGDWALPKKGNFGTWRTHAIANENEMNLIPDHSSITPIQAATVSVNLATAHRLLTQFAEMNSGDWFIQNGANSGVGRAAIQLGKVWGFKSINVVRNRSDIDSLKTELHNLGADKVVTEDEIASSDFSIAELIKDSSLKLALNCVGGESCFNISSQLSEDGHLVTYGSMSKGPISLPTFGSVFKNITAHGCWLSGWAAKNPEARYKLVLELLDLVGQGKIEDVPATINEWSLTQTVDEFGDTFMTGLKSNINGKGKQIFVLKN